MQILKNRPRWFHRLKVVADADRCSTKAEPSIAALREPPKSPCCTSPHCCKQEMIKPNGRKVIVLKPRVLTEMTVEGECKRCGWMIVWDRP